MEAKGKKQFNLGLLASILIGVAGFVAVNAWAAKREGAVFEFVPEKPVIIESFPREETNIQSPPASNEQESAPDAEAAPSGPAAVPARPRPPARILSPQSPPAAPNPDPPVVEQPLFPEPGASQPIPKPEPEVPVPPGPPTGSGAANPQPSDSATEPPAAEPPPAVPPAGDGMNADPIIEPIREKGKEAGERAVQAIEKVRKRIDRYL